MSNIPQVIQTRPRHQGHRVVLIYSPGTQGHHVVLTYSPGTHFSGFAGGFSPPIPDLPIPEAETSAARNKRALNYQRTAADPRVRKHRNHQL